MSLKHFVTLLIACFLHAQPAFGVITVWVGDPNEVLVVESNLTRIEVEKRRTFVRRLELRLLPQIKTREELEGQFSSSTKFAMDKLVRPVGADSAVGPENVRPADVQELLERSATFPIDGIGQILVFFAADGSCYLPGVLFLNASESTPRLTDEEFEKRLSWEAPMLDQVCKSVGTSMDELTPSDLEAKEAIESSKQLRGHFDKVRRTER